MTIVISDLVARVRAEGMAETKAQIQGVGQDAKLTADALQIMAEKAAKIGGGTAAGWLENFHRSGAAPTAAALAEAAKHADATATAVARIHEPTRTLAEHTERAAKGGEAIGKSFELSGSTLLRAAGALTGFNLGLNVVAGAAGQLHKELIASVDAAVAADRVGRSLTASYGAAAGEARRFAEGLGTQAGLAPTTVERGLLAARPLSTQFGLSGNEVQQLTTRAADLAGKYGQPFSETFQKAIEGVQSGGNQLEGYGVRLDDVYVKTVAYNGALASTFDKMTQAQQVGVRFKLFLDETDGAQGKAAASANTLSGAFDRLGGSGQRLSEALGKTLSGPAAGSASALERFLSLSAQALEAINSGKGLTAPMLAQPDARKMLRSDPNAPGGVSFQPPPTSPTFQIEGLTPIEGLATSTPQAFVGPRPLRAVDLLSSLDSLQGPAVAAAATARAGIADIGQASGGQLADLARRQAESSLLAAQVAGRNRANNQGLEGQLSVALGQATTGDERNRLSSQLSALREYQGVMAEIVAAEHDQAAAQREIAVAQAALTGVAIQQRERETETAFRLLDVRRQDLQAQQTVQRLTVDTTRAQISAQPALNAVADLDYRGQRTALLAQTRQARLLRGQSVADLPSFDQLISENVASQLDRPETALRALDATRGIDVSQRAVTGASLAQRITAAPLDAAQLGLQLKNLDDLPQQTKALQDLYAGQKEQLAAEGTSRDALVKLAALADKGSAVTVPVNITINGGSSETVAIVKREIADFEQRLGEALFESDQSGPPASSQLAGARRP